MSHTDAVCVTIALDLCLKADSHITCRAHAVRQSTHAMPRPCPAPTVQCPSWKSAW